MRLRLLGICGAIALTLAAALGAVRVVAQDATPVVDDGPVTMTLVERALNVTTVDLDGDGPTAGDLTVWGPDPLFDSENQTDTGAVTQGSCLAMNAQANHCVETILFADGSTLTIQGVQRGAGVPALTTITGGSGVYLGAMGTVLVEASEDLTLWTKTFEITF